MEEPSGMRGGCGAGERDEGVDGDFVGDAEVFAGGVEGRCS